MKILFISMHSIHSIRWIENLSNAGYELYWFDITDKGKIENFEDVIQFLNWKKRKIKYLKGEYRFSKKFPEIFFKIKHLFEITENEHLETIINKINPDIIHSFEMQSCSYQILKTMNKYPTIKWIYSSWGSDLFYYKNFQNHQKKIKSVLKRVNYLHSDCQRDFNIAKTLGFKGHFLGVIPGGGGYKLKNVTKNIIAFEEKKIILIKGYQHLFGRAIPVIKAISTIKEIVDNYKIVIFGAHKEVIDYVKKNQLSYTIYERNELNQNQLFELMGKSKLYIGNSISDGLPNTLLEAIICQVFPIQSNPGNVSAEIIEDRVNGLLINDPDDINEITEKIIFALNNLDIVKKAMLINEELSKTRLDYEINKSKIIAIYKNIIA